MGHNNEKKIERAAKLAQWVREEKVKADAMPVIEYFNARLEAGREPFFMPTIRAALITGHHWMIVVCRSCETVIDLDLRVKRRIRLAKVSSNQDTRRLLFEMAKAWEGFVLARSEAPSCCRGDFHHATTTFIVHWHFCHLLRISD